MGVIGATYILFPAFFLRFFTDAGGAELTLAEIFPVGRWLMVIMALWGLVDASNLVLSGALKGAGDTRFVMWFSFVMAWGVLVPGQFVLVIWLGQGVIVSWIWTAFYIALMAGGFIWRFRQRKWQSIDLLGSERPIEPNRPGAEAMLVVE